MTIQRDPLFPRPALLPLTERGGYAPPAHTTGSIRPWSASLAVVPIECGKDETTATRDTEVKQTQYTSDGKMETDAVPIIVTDS
ncbi:hypothetical protein [Actinokineospora pegani]|uniref:hypothetical protein n=1 Tax=Actinokineospora pegani TaxID=2654637 RepID=UPI0012EA70E7|nr:hypothetical protein [Actinokineospora pegani]